MTDFERREFIHFDDDWQPLLKRGSSQLVSAKLPRRGFFRRICSILRSDGRNGGGGISAKNNGFGVAGVAIEEREQ